MNTLKEFLKEKGLSIAKASRSFNIPYPTLYQHINGHREISAEMAKQYSKIMGIPLSSLRPDLWEPDNQQEQPPVEASR